MQTLQTKLGQSPVLPLASAGAGVASLAVAAYFLYRGIGSGNILNALVAAFIVFMFGLVLFLVAFLMPIVLNKLFQRHVTNRALTYTFFGLSGGAMGYGLPFVAGLFFVVPPAVGATAGLLGAIACAGACEYSIQQPSAFVTEERQLEFRAHSFWVLGIGIVVVVATLIATGQGPWSSE